MALTAKLTFKADGASQVRREADQAAGAVRRAHTDIKTHSEGISTALKTAMGALAGGALVAGVVHQVKAAGETIGALGKNASALHDIAGLNLNSAYQLTAISNAAGISNRSLDMSVKSLAMQYQGAVTGSAKAQQAFADLGISQQQLVATGGDMNKLMPMIITGLSQMPGGATKTADAAKLLGRNWAALNPLMADGGKEMQSLQGFASSLGLTLGDNTEKNISKLHDTEYKWNLMHMAIQQFIVNKLAPVLVKFSDWFQKKGIPAIRDTAGWINQHLIPALQGVWNNAKGKIEWVSQLVQHHPQLAAAALAIGAIAKVAGPVTSVLRGFGAVGSAAKGIAGLAGIGGQKSLNMEVGEMTVGVLYAKSMPGSGPGGGPGGVVNPKSLASDLEKPSSYWSNLKSEGAAGLKVGGGLIIAQVIDQMFSSIVQSKERGRATNVGSRLSLSPDVIGTLTQQTNKHGWPLMSPVRTNMPWGDQGNVLIAMSQAALKNPSKSKLAPIIQRAGDLAKLFPQQAPALNALSAALQKADPKAHAISQPIVGAITHSEGHQTWLKPHDITAPITAAVNKLANKKPPDTKVDFAPATTVVNIDGRQIAEATTRYVLKRNARGSTSLVGGGLATGTSSA